MRTIIIEDEHVAAAALSALIRETAPDIEIVAVLQSIDESVDWFKHNPMPDLVFVDIHLADGSSFSIFDETDISCPVVFTTAYDEYALKAFEVNSIDYLLKPIVKQDLDRAISKYRNLASPNNSSELLSQLLANMRRSAVYRSSLLVTMRDKLVPLSVNDIAYIHIDNKVVKAVGFGGNSYVLDQNMEELGEILDPAQFFRANRQFIISRTAVKDMSVWFGGKLAVNLAVPTPERIYISKAKVKEFKSWIMGN